MKKNNKKRLNYAEQSVLFFSSKKNIDNMVKVFRKHCKGCIVL